MRVLVTLFIAQVLVLNCVRFALLQTRLFPCCAVFVRVLTDGRTTDVSFVSFICTFVICGIFSSCFPGPYLDTFAYCALVRILFLPCVCVLCFCLSAFNLRVLCCVRADSYVRLVACLWVFGLG